MDTRRHEFEPAHSNSHMIRSPHNQNEWEAYFDLRYRVLRKPWGQVPGSERNEGDEHADHFAFFEKGKLIGVGRLDVLPEKSSQVRFMAVDPAYQGLGVGKKLMLHMEELAIKKGCTQTVLHARENALPFYQKLGYQITEKSHLLFNEIQHYLMHKNHGGNHGK